MEIHAINAPEQVQKLKYCLYTRKSSESDEKQALSIDSQIKEMLELAQREGIDVIDIKRESHSAKDTGQRPVFNELISEIKQGRFNGILAWHPDRLSRNAGDLGAIVDLIDQGRIQEVRTYGQRFTNNPSEKFLFMILGSQAKLENDNKSVNVKRGLKTRVEMGLWPSVAPTGYLNHPDKTMKCHVIPDPHRAHIIHMIFEKVIHESYSLRKIFNWLKDDLNFKTKNGKHLTISNIQTILKNNFYVGLIEYPKKSGKWYSGKHEPIVGSELFRKAQEKMSSNSRETRRESKEFAFTKLMTCGLCGSGVTAEEKFKERLDGTKRRYVYYGCTRYHDKQCKNTYLREDQLILQLIEVIDKIDINKIGIRTKLEKEIEKYNDFRNKILGITQTEEIANKNIDLKTYMKYILEKGSLEEKRELMQSITSTFILKDKKVVLS